MDKHVTVLGVLFLVLGIMGVIGMAIVAVIFLIGGAVISSVAAHEPDVPGIVSLIPVGFGVFICLAIAVSTIPSLVAGYGLLQKQRWSKVWALVAGLLNLPGFPLGTAVGIYAVWVALQAETESVLQ
jgi:hypothetical protein